MGTLNNVKRHAVRTGTLKRVAMNMYPGVEIDGKLVEPAVHIEHIGETNHSWMEERLREAGKIDDEIKAIRARVGTRTLADVAKTYEEEREQLIRHGVRHIEGWFYDGPDGDPDPANPVPDTAEGRRQVVESWDEAAVRRVIRIALNEENFRTTEKPTPAPDVAKK